MFLDAPVEELFLRSEQAGVARPLRRDLDQFRKLYEQRRPDYMKSALLVQTSGREVDEIVHEIVSALNIASVSKMKQVVSPGVAK